MKKKECNHEFNYYRDFQEGHVKICQRCDEKLDITEKEYDAGKLEAAKRELEYYERRILTLKEYVKLLSEK